MNYNPIIAQKRIRELRKKNGLTQNDLAQRFHVSRPVITCYESGKKTPNIMDLFILAEELCTCPEYLLGLTDDPSGRKEEKRILRSAVQTYGVRSQTDMMIEEMSELTKAILKYRRGANDETLNAILEEMADVEIVLDQMKIIFGSCAYYRRKKILRLANRLKQDKALNSKGDQYKR